MTFIKHQRVVSLQISLAVHSNFYDKKVAKDFSFVPCTYSVKQTLELSLTSQSFHIRGIFSRGPQERFSILPVYPVFFRKWELFRRRPRCGIFFFCEEEDMWKCRRYSYICKGIFGFGGNVLWTEFLVFYVDDMRGVLLILGERGL